MNWKWILIACIALTTSLRGESPEIVCTENPLFDKELSIEVVGLKPHQIIVLEASWIDEERAMWVSEAVFQADRAGVVEVAKQAPIAGSYRGIDPMGLFWSMEQKNVIPLQEHERNACGKYCFANQLKVYDGKQLVAERTICRCLQDDSVESVFIEENGLLGRLFLPETAVHEAVVIVLTGSNGGIQSGTAALIASHGIPAFALAYSGIGNLPEEVDNIPLEYFEKAFEWIDNHPRLSGKVFLHGTSRGAELALVLGSFFPDKVHKIVAIAPSSVVLSESSWTYHGEPILPAAPYFVDMNNDNLLLDSTRDKPRSIRIHRERGLVLEREHFDAAAIPVERITCPILLISGGDDQLGPCSIYSELILKRLDQFDSQIPCEHLDFPKAGHLISEPYFPRCNVFCHEGSWMNYGGTPKADEQASRESWNRILEFFNR
jgi:hypothetical protein